MNKRERIQAAIRGEKPDTLPYSIWTHLPDSDLDAQKLAQATYEFYKKYDVDFIKTMNNGMYAIEDFGCQVDYSEIAMGGVAKVVDTPVNAPEDWESVKPCDISKGSLARELYSLQLLLEKLKGENVPVLFTVFSPVTIAEKLSGKKLLQHIREGHSERIHAALRAITQTTAALAVEALRLGADGIFFATQLSNYNDMSIEQYAEFGKPYDLQVLEAAKGGWFNTLHAHGSDIMFELLRDYPVAVFNWHAWETLPALQEAHLLVGKCLMGGLKRMDITDGKRNELQHQIFESFRIMGGKNQILTPGCVIRYPLDEQMLAFVKETKDYVEQRFAGSVL